ncbi:hypothetical protein DRN93_06115, partial [archaeon]
MKIPDKGRNSMNGESVQEMTFDEAIDRIGFGAFQRKLLAICGAGWAADAMEERLISFALPGVF